VNLAAPTGWRCATCGATVGIAEPLVWRCPAATGADPRHLLLLEQPPAPLRPDDDPNPFVAFGGRLAWQAFAEANGMTTAECVALTRSVDDAVAAIEGTGFRWTPVARADDLSDELGFGANGGVWVKDETGNVSGSHKARHLLSILLHLRAAEALGLASSRSRPLAIASCGNAALAAATLAAADGRALHVFVPPWANRHVTERLGELGAEIVTCPRRDSGPPGDPCVQRFREAVAAGAIPFAVQGPENAWCLDGGRTIGWELAAQLERGPDVRRPADRLFVQVGGGALAACALRGLGDGGPPPRLHAVQAEGCAPLQRAWACLGGAAGAGDAARRWAECMRPWNREPASAATGILDDETYDWVAVADAMARTGGSPIVVPEAAVLEANELARRTTGIDVDHTGTAGLAGVIAARNHIADDERVVVLFTGRQRSLQPVSR
jgi:threonine synthase